MNSVVKSLHIRAVLQATKGRFTKIEYTNQKGEKKIYTVRTGVKKYLVNNESSKLPVSLEPLPYVKVYSITKGNQGYKTFYPERITFLKCGKMQVI